MKQKAIIDLSRLDNMINEKDRQIKSKEFTALEKEQMRLTRHGLVLARALCREAENEPKNVGIEDIFVPYQCCPLCNGTGKTIADGFTSSIYQACKVCNGAMVIPMHVLDWRVNQIGITEPAEDKIN